MTVVSVKIPSKYRCVNIYSFNHVAKLILFKELEDNYLGILNPPVLYFLPYED